MGCCESRHKFDKGDEFGDAYNNYFTLNDKFNEKYKEMLNIQERINKRQFYANYNLKSLNDDLTQSRINREQAYRKLENIYDRLKDSNTLGKDAEIKTRLFEELVTEREKEKERMEADFNSSNFNQLVMFKDE
jgi:hypothetical protein